MQRFKKHNSLRYKNAPALLKGQHPEHGKFVYGANGTLTQAARWRDGMWRALAEMRQDWPLFRENAWADLEFARSYRKSAREGGCYLP